MVFVGVAVRVPVIVGVSDGVRVAVGVLVIVGEGVQEGVRVCVTAGVNVLVRIEVWVRVIVGVAVRVPVIVAVGGTGVFVAVGDGVHVTVAGAECVGPVVGVELGTLYLGVCVGVFVAVFEGVKVLVGVFVGVFVCANMEPASNSPRMNPASFRVPVAMFSAPIKRGRRRRRPLGLPFLEARPYGVIAFLKSQPAPLVPAKSAVGV